MTACRLESAGGNGHHKVKWPRHLGGTTVETIRLTDVGGITHLCGVDRYAQHWFEFWADTDVRDRGELRCAVCGREITNGWICSVNGTSVCHDHIAY